MYDGVEEFYVTIREKGERKQEESQEEIRRKLSAVEALLSCTFISYMMEIMVHRKQIQQVPYKAWLRHVGPVALH